MNLLLAVCPGTITWLAELAERERVAVFEQLAYQIWKPLSEATILFLSPLCVKQTEAHSKFGYIRQVKSIRPQFIFKISAFCQWK